MCTKCFRRLACPVRLARLAPAACVANYGVIVLRSRRRSTSRKSLILRINLKPPEPGGYTARNRLLRRYFLQHCHEHQAPRPRAIESSARITAICLAVYQDSMMAAVSQVEGPLRQLRPKLCLKAQNLCLGHRSLTKSGKSTDSLMVGQNPDSLQKSDTSNLNTGAQATLCSTRLTVRRKSSAERCLVNLRL